MKNQISNNPPKGTVDWFPEEFRIRQYIFNAWRKVCLSYGFEEYLSPLVENADVYRAKSGEDIGGKELVTFTDKGGRELSIRPEMTPSVTRMITRIYDKTPKPIRYFSIANFMRNEKPQRGRNREFWQLNFDVFGSNSINADIEVAQMAIDILLELKAPKDSFVFYVNNRKLIDGILDIAEIRDSQRVATVRVMDKYEKLSKPDFIKALKNIKLNTFNIETLIKFMENKDGNELVSKLPQLASNEGLREIEIIINKLRKLGYGEWIRFKPSMIRGFDYYDGLIFEVFDLNPKNNRAMFGGGRYNGLAEIFGSRQFPAVGFAPGDETTRLFLESWGLIDNILEDTEEDKTYLPLLAEELESDVQLLAKNLRLRGDKIETGFEVQKINKALDYANKKGIDKVIILGTKEKKKGIYKLKDMNTGKEIKVRI